MSERDERKKHGAARTTRGEEAPRRRSRTEEEEPRRRTRREEEPRGNDPKDSRRGKDRSQDRPVRKDDRPGEKTGKSGGKKKKKGGGALIFLSMILILMLLIAAAFGAGTWYFMDHFSYGSTINGDSIFGMTLPEVENMLADDMDDYTLVIRERTHDGGSSTEEIFGLQIGLKIVYGDALVRAMNSQSGIGWILDAIYGKPIDLGSMVAYEESMWQDAMDGLQCFQKNFVQEPVDAYIQTEEELKIVPEVYGNQADRDKVEKLLSRAVLGLTDTVDLEAENVYKTPAILSTDKALNEEYQVLKKYAEMTIIYKFGDVEEKLDGQTITTWLVSDENGDLKADPAKVEAYVAGLRKKYDTIFRTRTFRTSYGETVTLTEGDYGWWMNYKKEEQELKAMIDAGQGGERTPEYYQTANQYGSEDWGDTYIEANLTAQHLFFYQDGEVVFETDFVSGKNTSDRRTPEGIYGITYKERFAYLEGVGYKTPVSYWMPFNGNVGLHDATWRTSFGKNFYKNGGSHGCLNLPCEAAKTIYSLIRKGTPVIVYSLPGTESDHVTKQDSTQIAQCCTDAFAAIPTVVPQKKAEVLKWMRSFYNEIGGAARKKVTNLDILKDAEKAQKAG